MLRFPDGEMDVKYRRLDCELQFIYLVYARISLIPRGQGFAASQLGIGQIKSLAVSGTWNACLCLLRILLLRELMKC